MCVRARGRYIRKELRLQSLPVVAFSAELGDEVRVECEATAFNGFIAKPADREVLRGEIDRLVLTADAALQVCPF